MPTFASYTKKHLGFALSRIGDAIYREVAALEITAWWSPEPIPFDQRQSGQGRQLSVGDKWGDLFDCAWFRFRGQVPASAAGHKVVLLIDVNGELCVFDRDGMPVRGLTTRSSGYDFSLGRPGKRVLHVTDCAQGGEMIDVWADGGCNDLFGNLQGDGRIKEASIAICYEDIRALYYDYEVLLDLLGVLPEESARYRQILVALNDATHALRELTPQEAQRARALLAPQLAQKGGDPSLRISAVGHAHMDLGWLWPIRETIRKGARTFSTVLDLMDHYTDYVFGASQPQYFLWMKERYPGLYARIGEKIREGRIEPQGGMWVEADTNVSGGEALVRQLLQGKRFFKHEFGADIDYLWIPDVFGYSAALPQILRKAGVNYFTTQKMSWSQINTFPHQSFHWQGIDGTSVLTHMLPEETYNSPAAPRSLAKIERNYRDAGVSRHALLVFGIGDGGGGPGEEHLERLARLKNLAGLCPVAQEPAAAFYPKWAEAAERFPTWVGELYLERHQGTLTTQARNKRYNRQIEQALRDWEWAATVDALLDGTPYPAESLQTIWREVLLYQFHDILPGSSIKRVYDESVPRYRAMLQEVQRRIGEADLRFAQHVDTGGMQRPFVARNSLSWRRQDWVKADGKWLHVAVPPMGYCAVDADGVQEFPQVTAASDLLENEILRVRFHADGSLASVYDKQAGRETIASGEAGNRLAVYADHGDAWDFPMDYAERPPRIMQLAKSEPRVDGPCAILRQTYRLGHSELVQEIRLMAGSRRLDFETSARWRETMSMLRTSFPVAVHADEAAFEIQFGHIRRPTHQNTTWDLARDEVAAHKWVDLSQRDFGVALLNDCKYGHKVKGHVIDLDLLRSVPYPGPRLVRDQDVQPGEPHHAYTDQCDHLFTYSLYPHLGDHATGRVVQASYELNIPLRVVACKQTTGDLPAAASLLEIGDENVIVEAVKWAEEGDDVIIRLYEAAHQETRTWLRVAKALAAAWEASLMEEPRQVLSIEARKTIRLDMKPFEIKTLRLRFA